MNYYMRVFLNIFVGIISNGLMLAIAGYLIGLYTPSKGGDFISFSKPELIGMIVGLLFGATIGAILGAIVVGFTLNIPQAIILGFFLNIIISVFLVFYTGEDPFHNNQLSYLLISLIISGSITGLIVSFAALEEKTP